MSTSTLMDVGKYGIRRITEIRSENFTIGASRPCGVISVVPAHTQLYLENWQRKDRAVHGRNLFRQLRGMRNLTFENLQWLSKNAEFFPADWKRRSANGSPLFVCFWGTDVIDSMTGCQLVFCTWWDAVADSMDIGLRPVDSFFGDNFPAAQAVG